jgi:hypothetical protein
LQHKKWFLDLWQAHANVAKHSLGFEQGCQMVYFQTKNPNLGKFGRVLKWKM